MNLFLELLKFIYCYCTDFVINIANLTHLSYYEINFLIFVVLYPSVTLLLAVIYFLKKKKLTELETKANQNGSI